MFRIRLTLEYDGTDFVGWQAQKNGRSVQEEVEKAIKQILQEDVRITGAGRTDAGVHARKQVASFVVHKEVDNTTLPVSLNAVLPKDVVIHDATIVDQAFHARYVAKSRRYKYYISKIPTSIMRNYCWQIFYPLDFEVLQQCAKTILGEHDFQSFSKVDTDVKDYICYVTSADWKREDNILVFDITANRFLYGMVRALVGTMVDVGRGHFTILDFNKILNAKTRNAAGMSAPAKGLFLEEISY